MSMRVISSAMILSLAIVTGRVGAVEGEEVYRCAGVYVNRPCQQKESGGRVTSLPRLGRISSAESPRASLNPDALVELDTIAAVQPDAPRRTELVTFGQVPRSAEERELRELLDSAKMLKKHAKSIADTSGVDTVRSSFSRVFTQVQIQCAEIPSSLEEKRLCRDLTAALHDVYAEIASLG